MAGIRFTYVVVAALALAVVTTLVVILTTGEHPAGPPEPPRPRAEERPPVPEHSAEADQPEVESAEPPAQPTEESNDKALETIPPGEAREEVAPPDEPADKPAPVLWMEGSIEEREAAAKALGETKDPSKVGVLLKALRDPEDRVKRAASSSLYKVVDESSIPQLVEVVDDEDWFVMGSACGALAEIGEPAMPHLLKVLKSGKPEARAQAISCLMQKREERERLLLRRQKFLEEPKEEQERILGLKGLAHRYIYETPLAPSALDKEPLAQVFREALGDPDEQVRLDAVVGLRRLGDKQAVEPLINALGDEVFIVRHNAGYALMGILGEDVHMAARKALHHHDVRIRRGAAAIPWLCPEAPMLHLEALKDEDEQVRKSAACMWRQLKPPVPQRLIEHFLQAIKDPDLKVRRTAAGYLAMAKKPELLELFLQLSADQDVSMRYAAISGIGGIVRSARATPPVRDIGHSIIQSDEGKRGIPVLFSALEDPDKNVRRAAATELENIAGNAFGSRPRENNNKALYEELKQAIYAIRPAREADEPSARRIEVDPKALKQAAERTKKLFTEFMWAEPKKPEERPTPAPKPEPAPVRAPVPEEELPF